MVLVERQEHLAVFTTALEKCRAGSGGLLAVTSPMATGKTALLRVFAERATDAGFLVVQGTGARTERELPLGLVNQFRHDLPLAVDTHSQTDLVQQELHRTVVRHGPERMVPGPQLASLLHKTSVALLNAHRQTPMLFVVDDLHHVDPLSLHCLLFFVRRIRSAPVLLVTAGGELVGPTDPQLYAELMEHSTEHLVLPPLSRGGVAKLLAEALGEQPTDAVVDACTRVSGGNPLLTGALIKDLTGSGTRPVLGHDGQVHPGRAYTSAIRRYVERLDPVTRRVLAASALFDGQAAAGPLTLARLAEVDTAAAHRALSGLESAGLVIEGRISHPRGRQAVLDQVLAESLTELHLRAARILHEEGSTPLPIARHLLAAGQAPTWAGPVLTAAALEQLGAGDTEHAVAMLRLAHDGAAEGRERAALKVALLHAEWRTDPAAAGHRLTQLAAAARAGQLSPAAQLDTAACVLWLGRTAEAAEMLEGLGALTADTDHSSEIRFLQAWTRYTHPGLLGYDPVELPAHRRGAEGVVNPREALAYALDTLLAKGPTAAAVFTAEQCLPRSPLSGGSLAPLAAALTILIHADHLETAALWTDRLLIQAEQRRTPSWYGMLLAVRAEIALRAGQMAEAQRHAETALATLSPESWGPALGVPLSSAVFALVMQGRLEEAGRHLEQPVPDAMFHTVWGLHYLRARGAYYLATGRAEGALDDFATCGDLMTRWNLDLPSLMPWRVHAAHAHLALNQPEQARALAESQLTQLGSEPSRTKGAALRVLAAVAPLVQRPTLLRDAAEILRSCGDRLELAHTLADLGQAQRGLGDFHRARMTVRRAYDLAGDCHADALRRRLLPDVDLDGTVPESAERTVAEAFNSLSDAERRVAALAAQGSTNRQIARKLYVTVSTVEQHLTKIYRKLDVTRRADLLVKLKPRISNVA